MLKKVLLVSALGMIGAGLALADPPAPPAPPKPAFPPFMAELDPNRDGVISRDEASALADQNFDAMDTNDDGKLTPSDRPARAHRVMIDRHADVKAKDGEERRIERVIIHRGGGDGETREEEVIETENGQNRIIIQKGRGGRTPNSPNAKAPHAPMMMMIFASHEESDLDGDGALSKAEFKAQQLRFFDASDANRDGKVKLDLPMFDMPEPPQPPAPPAPPKR